MGLLLPFHQSSQTAGLGDNLSRSSPVRYLAFTVPEGVQGSEFVLQLQSTLRTHTRTPTHARTIGKRDRIDTRRLESDAASEEGEGEGECNQLFFLVRSSPF